MRNSSPLRRRYLARNPILVWGLTAVDTLLSVRGGGTRGAREEVGAPRRVLLSMGGHLGDVVIASSVLPLVRSVWPETEIGLLVGSWSRSVVERHPLVRWIHTVDHWKLNRSETGHAQKLRRFRSTRRRALHEIRAIGYDAAVDLYPLFPNTIPLLWRAGIPVRAGYESGGFGGLLTHPVPWADTERHMAEAHRELLSMLDSRFAPPGRLRYSLPGSGQAGVSSELVGGDYLVLHTGAGLRLKEWPAERWRALVDRLTADGHTLVFTGRGEEQVGEVDRIIEGRAKCLNLCDRLGWDEFITTLAGARLVISVDSVAGHLAAAVNTPVVVLMSGMNRIGQWIPLGDSVTTVTHPVPCAPCHRSRGCAAMTCVREIRVEDVLRAVRGELAKSGEGQGLRA
jgi:ADP-heptose:LPS heptosyltransferase